MRILLAAHIKWYNAEAEYVHRLALRLIRMGHEPLVWGKKDSPLLRRASASGVSTYGEGDPSSIGPGPAGRAAAALSHLVRRGGFEVVDFHRSEGYPLLARAAKRAGAAVVRTRADMRPFKFAAVNGMIHRSLTDYVITGNDLLRDNFILRLGYPAERVATARFGIDPGEVRPSISEEKARAELGLTASDKVVGIMGRLGPVKGQEFVLRAAGKILASEPLTRFLVIFNHHEESDKFLPELRRSPYQDKFTLAGTRENPADVMQVCRAAIIPSVGSEAHCRVALEWMDMGVPVIGSRVGVIPELIDHGDTGYLVQPRYSDAIAECALQLLKYPERARAMGLAGQKKLAAEFSLDKTAEDNVDAFERAVRLARR